ncbi:TPA: hypothetical protein ACH3X1_004075 [Trebouxia sp. C0004]
MQLSCARQCVGPGYPSCSTVLWHRCRAASQHVSCTHTRRSLLTSTTGRSGSVNRQHKDTVAALKSNIDDAAADSVQGRLLTVHYLRRGDVRDWRLHTWGEVQSPTKEFEGLQPDRCTNTDAQFRLQLIPDHQKNGYSHWIGLQLRKGDQLDAGGEIVEISTDTHEVWLVQGAKEVFMEKADIISMLTGDLTKSYAHWTDQHTVLWRSDKALLGQDEPVFKLHYSRQGNLKLTGEGITHADGSYQLEDTAQQYKLEGQFPHLAGCKMLAVPALPYDEILQCQLAVTMETSGGHPLAATGVQIPGVLDDLFFYEGLLGAHLGPQGVDISLWAPTAQQVDLLVFDGLKDDQAMSEEHMTLHKGVWSHQVCNQAPRARNSMRETHIDLNLFKFSRNLTGSLDHALFVPTPSVEVEQRLLVLPCAVFAL